MPRQPRYFIEGIPQHVIQRGVDRQAVFFDQADYGEYRRCLCDAANQYSCRVHAYVLMTNHTHLLITPCEKRSLPLLMQAMGRTYVQRINRTYKRTGTLWQGRYKASLVQDDRYLLTCYRYIELNPVRTGMVAHPAEYPHSSYRHNAMAASDPLITEHEVYRLLGTSDRHRRQIYRRLFEDAIAESELHSIRETTNACGVLGNERFKDQIEAMINRRVRPGKTGSPKKSALDER